MVYVGKTSSNAALATSAPTLGEGEQLTVAQLRALPWPRAIRKAGLQLTIDDSYVVGKLIVESIHGGARDTHKSRKQWSLRRIQTEILSEASFATLARCVQTYEACLRLKLEPPLGDVRVGHLLSLSHLDLRKQRQLIQRVEGQRLSVEALRSATGRNSSSRRRKPEIVKVVSFLAKQDLMQGLDLCERYSASERRKLARAIAALRRQLERVEKRLTGRRE